MKIIIDKFKIKLKEFIYKRYNISFSQGGGDDIQLNKLLKRNEKGVFVDIGCWHPIKGSNTYYFYLRGWKGICVDPNSQLESLYNLYRPKDTFVNCAIGIAADEKVFYYQLKEGYTAMNTLNYASIEKHNLKDKIMRSDKVPIYSLKDILDKNLKLNDRLDFFDIDVEGLDLEVLKSNDWVKYRPKVIMIETDLPIQNDISSDIVKYLELVDYKLVSKSVINGDLGNLFLLDKKSI